MQNHKCRAKNRWVHLRTRALQEIKFIKFEIRNRQYLRTRVRAGCHSRRESHPSQYENPFSRIKNSFLGINIFFPLLLLPLNSFEEFARDAPFEYKHPLSWIKYLSHYSFPVLPYLINCFLTPPPPPPSPLYRLEFCEGV